MSMLVLARKPGQSIRIGDDITVTVIKCQSGWVRLSVEAPRHVRVDREEIAQARENNNTEGDDDGY